MHIYLPNIYNQSPLSIPLLPHRRLSISDNHRSWKRRRVKSIRPPVPPPPQFRCYLNLSSSSFESLYNNFISQIPSLSPNSLISLAPAIGFASGIAIYLSRNKKLTSNSIGNSGEWILFTSPTPFNRFVILRCPSICFEGSGLLDNVNERLLTEDMHFVRLNSGRVLLRESGDDENSDEKQLVYQRVCVGTEDGGVVSIDWPANLDLEEERGLDTTAVIVPGTTEGSGEKCVREFVCECLMHGWFPLVMNPRGCAGSPLTTAR